MFDGVFVRLRWLRWQCVAGRGREQVLGLALPNINFQPQILIQSSIENGGYEKLYATSSSRLGPRDECSYAAIARFRSSGYDIRTGHG